MNNNDPNPTESEHLDAIRACKACLGATFALLVQQRIGTRLRQVRWIVAELRRQGVTIPDSLRRFEDS